MTRVFVAVALVLLELACAHPASTRLVVYLFDATASLTDAARANGVKTLDSAAAWLGRGDDLVVLPIVDDAATTTPGQILRFRLPAEREPFDEDRVQLSTQIASAADGMLQALAEHPYLRTDVFGALALAAEEFASDSHRDKILAVLCDFLQDDDVANFRTDPRLASVDSAINSAKELAVPHSSRFAGVSVYLGSVQSIDLARVPDTRREAVRVFWTTFLEAQGATVRWRTDGVSALGAFLTGVRS